MEADIRNLRKHRLVEQRAIEGHSSYSTRVLTLTKEGHGLLRRTQCVSDPRARRMLLTFNVAGIGEHVREQTGNRTTRNRPDQGLTSTT